MLMPLLVKDIVKVNHNLTDKQIYDIIWNKIILNEFIDLGTMSLTVHGASKNYSVYIKNSAVVMNGPVSYTLIEKEK